MNIQWSIKCGVVHLPRYLIPLMVLITNCYTNGLFTTSLLHLLYRRLIYNCKELSRILPFRTIFQIRKLFTRKFYWMSVASFKNYDTATILKNTTKRRNVKCCISAGYDLAVELWIAKFLCMDVCICIQYRLWVMQLTTAVITSNNQ